MGLIQSGVTIRSGQVISYIDGLLSFLLSPSPSPHPVPNSVGYEFPLLPLSPHPQFLLAAATMEMSGTGEGM
jgi:hypothetical protein